ncbi:hypothetical protein S7711_10122, partial [Stachybotrys chartarum IBT 7711]
TDNTVTLLDEIRLPRIDRGSTKLPITYIFTGQGAQYPHVGKALLESSSDSLFRQTIRDLDATLQSLPFDLRPNWGLEQTILAEPHVSQGEIGAAYAAEFLDAREAIILSHLRGVAVGKLTGAGTMLAVGQSPQEAAQILGSLGLEKKLCIACINSPISVTISGDSGAAEKLLEHLVAEKIFARKLVTGGRAYHSHLVREVCQMYEELITPYIGQRLEPVTSGEKNGCVRMITTVGFNDTKQNVVGAEQVRKSKYWRDNLEMSVHFSSALEELMKGGQGYHLIEVGPHAALKGPVEQVRKALALEATLFPYSGTLIRSEDAQISLKKLAANLFAQGHCPPWQVAAAEKLWRHSSEAILDILGGLGVIITPRTEDALEFFETNHFEVYAPGKNALLAIKDRCSSTPVVGKDVVIMIKDPSQAVQDFADSLSDNMKAAGSSLVRIVQFENIQGICVAPNTLNISLLELEKELLAMMNAEEMDTIRSVTDKVTNLLWLTGAGMLSDSPNPNLTLSSGLSRALMLEQPSLRYCIMDIGSIDRLPSNLCPTLNNIHRVLVTPYEEVKDQEFIQVNDILYISRFMSRGAENELFRRRKGHDDPLQRQELSSSGLLRLSVGRPVITDTLHFRQIRHAAYPPPEGFIDVEVKAVSLNAKDVYNLSGHAETTGGTSALEFCGTVVGAGTGIDHVAIGDRVVVMAPNHFTTIERVPAWAACKLLPDEENHSLCTVPISYAPALYALQDRARMRSGESVLIHAGSGAFGTAAIQVATLLGVTVYTTCSSEAKRKYIINELGVPSERIFGSRTAMLAKDVKAATGSRGVDVVINSLVGDLMHASWDCLAPFGRFVEIGKRELADAKKLQMGNFLKSTTFTAFDLSELFYHEDQYYRDVWVAKLREALDLYRSGQIKLGPIVIYDASDISSAFRAFSAKDRAGKIVVSLEDGNSQVLVAPAPYSTVLSPDKIYLLVGCLGGLGRSLSRWMLQQGACHFAFMGRTGADRPAARSLIEHLERNGASVLVVTGDVSEATDVRKAVLACLATGRSIGGVLQAALGLSETIFSRMTNEAWHAAADHALDFFLLMSSVSGSVATATESNYCAANAFLDAWARWRRQRGQKAVSVGFGMISEVGYLHENPDIESLLLRKGIQPLDEEKFWQVVDLALSGSNEVDEAHWLTGLESQALRTLVEKGWDVQNSNMLDPRSAVLSASLLAAMDSKPGAAGDRNRLVDMPDWLTGVASSAARALSVEAEAASSLADAVLSVTRRRFSTLVPLPMDAINDNQSITQFGVDSMIAAEFRTWIWQTFGIDIPFLDLLNNHQTLKGLAEIMSQALNNQLL